MRRWLILLLLCSPAAATITRVGSSVTNNCAGGTSCAVSRSPTAGNFLAVLITFNTSGTAITSVTDNGSGGSSTYASSFNTACAGFECALFYTCNLKASVTTITANYPSSDVSAVQVIEYSGIATTSCQDQVSTQATGSGTTMTANSITTVNAADLILGAFHNATSTSAFSGSGSYATVTTASCASCGSAITSVEQIVSSTNTYSATATNGSTVTWEGYTVAFKGAASSSGPNVGFKGKVGLNGKVGVI